MHSPTINTSDHQDAKTLLQEEEKLMDRVDTDVDYNMEGNVICLSQSLCFRKQIIHSRPAFTAPLYANAAVSPSGQVAHNRLGFDLKALGIVRTCVRTKRGRGKVAEELGFEVDVRAIQSF